ncbi:MAG TPA: tetratricopeptide repeat protein [Tepidisphaeraceae bacterium]|jgi:tetratricopeptide (TPR) repeat protein
MNIRPKTVRRLLVLFAAFLLLLGGVVLLVLRSIRKEKATVAGMRQSAFRAYDMHDYASAVSLFGGYVNRSPVENSDAEAIYAYAIAREHVPMGGQRQIPEAINLFQRYLDLDPADRHDAGHELLRLYARARYNNEALTLADKLLAKNPKDVEAVRTRVGVLVANKKPADALKACHALNQVDPGNIAWEERELQLMSELKQPNQQIVAHARQLLESHTGDPRFHAILASALDLTGDSAGAIKSLEDAAQLPAPDPDAAIQIISLLNMVPRIDLSDAVLNRSLSQFKDPRLEEMSLQRLFETDAYGPLLDKLKDLNSRSPASPPTSLAYKAMALYQLNRRPEADAIVAALAGRKDDVSVAWTGALRARFASPPMDPAAMITAYRDAVARDRLNPVFYYFRGEARAVLGETDEALRDWGFAARLSPTWTLPLFRMSRTLSSTGRYADAMRVAQAMLRRAPGSIGGKIACTIADWGRIQQDPAELQGDEGQNLLKNLEAIRSSVPNEPETLPAYVALLSRRGQREKAIAAIQSAMAAPTPLPETTFGQLLAVDQHEHLGLQQQILDGAEKSHGLTAAIAYERARSLYNAGKKDEAAELVKSLRRSHPSDPQWLLSDARFRDATGDPEALNTWKAACAAQPDNIRVQYAALSTPVRFADRAFWQKTIERVKALTGPDAQAWQVEEARFRLSGQATPQELEQSVAALQKIVQASPELADVHRLLAQTLLRLGKPESLGRATSELTAAHDLQPDDFGTTSQLVVLMASQGMRDRALAMVTDLAHRPTLTAEQRLWAASTFGQLGSPQDGIKLLTSADAVAQMGSKRDDLLANLCLRAGRMDDARKAFQKILDDPAAAPSGLVHAADFFAASHRADKADQCLARLKEMTLDDASADLLRAHLQEQEGNPDEAAKTLTEATRTHSNSEQAWRELAGLHLRNANLDEADKVAAAGLQAIPNAPALTAMRLQIGRLRTLDRRDVIPLLLTLSHDPRQPAAQATVAALADAQARHLSAQDTLANLRQLADQYTEFLPLQEIVVKRYLAARRYKDATDVASRTVELAPGDPAPLKMLTEIQITAGDFAAGRATANRWRQASAGNPLEPDLAIARTYLMQGDPDPASALKQLEPYMADAAPELQRLATTPLYCRALLAAGRFDDAAARLQPLIAKSPQWVGVWLELATAGAKGVNASTQWLKRLAPLLPANSPGLQIALAQAWHRVGFQFDSTAAIEAARDMLQPIVAKPPVPAAAWEVWALVQQSLSNLPEAEHAWDEFLKLDADNSSAKNNLAFVLLLEGDAAKLPRAQSLAKEAVAAAPDASTFYDTLARIEGQLGHRPEAIRNFRQAIDKNPADIEAMVGLADALQSQPDGRDEARALLTRISALLDGGTPLLPPIRKELDRVKTALSASL